MTLKELNALSNETLRAELARCCGSPQWVSNVADRRPFADAGALERTAEQVWSSLGPKDWKEAFAHHPKIGDVKSLRKKFADTARWAQGEQARAATAPEAVLRELAEENERYLKKFGFIFIVCAAGKTADEMLTLLKSRLPNSAEKEVRIAAGEQSKITQLRLGKLLS